jgi:hypothetical protein
MNQFEQLKKLIVAPNPGLPVPFNSFSTFSAGADNYGCWDGNNFWIGRSDGRIGKISSTGVSVQTFPGFIAPGGAPLQLAFDGRYVWVGDYDSKATLFKFDTTINKIVASGQVRPDTNSGGCQGVVWDGSKLWIGAPDQVIRMNTSPSGFPTTELIVSGQSNVNGLSYYTDTVGQVL